MRFPAMLEAHQHLARQIVIDDGGSGFGKNGPVLHTRGAERIVTKDDRKRHPAASTARRADKTQSAPAGCAERIVLVHHQPAAEAARRQCKRDRPCEGRKQAFAVDRLSIGHCRVIADAWISPSLLIAVCAGCAATGRRSVFMLMRSCATT